MLCRISIYKQFQPINQSNFLIAGEIPNVFRVFTHLGNSMVILSFPQLLNISVKYFGWQNIQLLQ